MAVVSASGENDEEFIINPETEEGVIDGEEATIISGEAGSNQVLINSGDAYQTVTIVPTDNNPGEVSYVLIVQQDEGKDDEEGGDELDQDMTVYDFDENEEAGGLIDSEAEDDKSKIVKILPRKSQTVTQAHMCNYCNYTSPKRYKSTHLI